MTNEREIVDLDEEVINFINDFLIDQSIQIDPDFDIKGKDASKKLTGFQTGREQYHYFFKNTPLLYLDLKLLIDGT